MLNYDGNMLIGNELFYSADNMLRKEFHAAAEAAAYNAAVSSLAMGLYVPRYVNVFFRGNTTLVKVEQYLLDDDNNGYVACTPFYTDKIKHIAYVVITA